MAIRVVFEDNDVANPLPSYSVKVLNAMLGIEKGLPDAEDAEGNIYTYDVDLTPFLEFVLLSDNTVKSFEVLE